MGLWECDRTSGGCRSGRARSRDRYRTGWARIESGFHTRPRGTRLVGCETGWDSWAEWTCKHTHTEDKIRCTMINSHRARDLFISIKEMPSFLWRTYSPPLFSVIISTLLVMTRSFATMAKTTNAMLALGRQSPQTVLHHHKTDFMWKPWWIFLLTRLHYFTR